MQNNEGIDWVLDRIGLGIQVINQDGSVRYQNGTAARSPYRFHAEDGSEEAAQPEQTKWMAAFRTCVQTGAPVRFVEQRTDDGGGKLWIEHRFDLVKEAVLIVSADITGQKKAELALERSEGRFSVAFHSSPVGIAISLFKDGTFIEVNDEACHIYGYTREELIGRTSVELGIIDAETRKRLLSEIKTRERLRAFELPLRSQKGEIRTVLFSWDAIEFDDLPCVIATIIDITELRKLEEQNRKLQRMESIGSLAGGIVHDLNNVLGPIMLVLGTLQRKLVSSEDREAIDMLQQKSRRAAELVRQILTFARGSQSKHVPIQLNRIAEEVLGMVTPTFPANITLRKRFPAGLYSISADATQLIQVMLNLVVNARDAMPDGGTITLEGENITIDPLRTGMAGGVKPGSYVVLKVTDTGQGMTQEVRENIFNPFFTTKEAGKGTGLGLSTVASIVKAHDGEMQVESEPGRGTEFRIYFPADHAAGAGSRTGTAAAVPPGNGELILFVDDDAIVREVVKIALEAGGYHMLGAVDGPDAVAQFGKERERIAAVVTDMDLPLMDGIILAGVLTKMDPTVRIIGSSGTPDVERLGRFNESGIREFLAKPYTSETLLRTIHSVITRPSEGE